MAHKENCDGTSPPIEEMILKQGFFLANFEADGYLPAFSYTIGLFEKCSHPEVLIMGLPVQTHAGLLESICEEIKTGITYEAGKSYSGILNEYDVQFLRIADEYLPSYFGFGREYYKYQPFPAIQLVWPDKKGKWPWDDSFNEDFLFCQKLLDRDVHFQFFERKNVVTYTSDRVLAGETITDVFHYEDGSWSFLADEPALSKTAKIVCLEEVAKLDPSINELFDLGFEKSAHRNSRDDKWVRDN